MAIWAESGEQGPGPARSRPQHAVGERVSVVRPHPTCELTPSFAPQIIWQPVANALVEAGYEVALFDVGYRFARVRWSFKLTSDRFPLQLYGRGYSSAPRGTYKNALYINQVLGVLDKLGWREPVFLAGLSMGGPICAEFTATFPERVKKVAMLAPAAFFGVVRGDGVWLLSIAGESVLPAMSDAHVHSVASPDVEIRKSHAPRTLVQHRYILAVPQGWAEALLHQRIPSIRAERTGTFHFPGLLSLLHRDGHRTTASSVFSTLGARRYSAILSFTR